VVRDPSVEHTSSLPTACDKNPLSCRGSFQQIGGAEP
jgi:hypothetical protein